MYAFLLPLHSLVRWFVLISLVVSIFISWRGWLGKKKFTSANGKLLKATEHIANLQFVIGVCLYFISPVVSYFLNNFKTAVQQREIRFFGMEHVTMMIIGVALTSIASAKARRKETDTEKFKAAAIWLTIALLVILSSVPWAFSPLVNRPWFRPF